MYTNDSEVSGNVSIGNHVGYAIMYSNRLVIRDNISDRDRDHGLHGPRRSSPRGSTRSCSRTRTAITCTCGR